jgi:hypothetical protein
MKRSTSRPAPVTTTNLASVLANSISPFSEKMRFRPAIGSSFSSFGCIASVLNTRPPSIAGPASAAISTATNSGSSSVSAIIAE